VPFNIACRCLDSDNFSCASSGSRSTINRDGAGDLSSPCLFLPGDVSSVLDVGASIFSNIMYFIAAWRRRADASIHSPRHVPAYLAALAKRRFSLLRTGMLGLLLPCLFALSWRWLAAFSGLTRKSEDDIVSGYQELMRDVRRCAGFIARRTSGEQQNRRLCRELGLCYHHYPLPVSSPACTANPQYAICTSAYNSAHYRTTHAARACRAALPLARLSATATSAASLSCCLSTSRRLLHTASFAFFRHSRFSRHRCWLAIAAAGGNLYLFGASYSCDGFLAVPIQYRVSSAGRN